MRSAQEHFVQLEIILQRHVAALETAVRALQVADKTAQWSAAWKPYYHRCFAKIFASVKIFRNWGADAAGQQCPD
ncbi:MAG: hypothetical protein HC941_15250 [Microcoleus sp. SU_5_3]|nr:hypothetical protein [Microcoleus sp. SU_5_3]